MTAPSYYEHSCGFYHVVGHNGGCDDDATRFIAEELNERHGEGNWEEVDAPEETISVTTEVRRKNYDRLMALTPDRDIDGKAIEISCRVRCFLATYYDPGNDWLIGLNTTGACSYTEGTLSGFRTVPADGDIPATDCYVVAMERTVCPTHEKRHNTFTMKNETQTLAARGEFLVPVNGTLVKGIRVSDKGVFTKDPLAVSWKTFGVVRI